MSTERPPWTAGRLREELAKYPDDTPLRVSVADADYPDEIDDCEHVVLGAARGQERSNGGQVTLTPFLILESYPLGGVEVPGVGE